MAWHGMAWHGMAWHCMAQLGTAWHGTSGVLFNSMECQFFLLSPAALCRFPFAPVTDGHMGDALHALEDRCPPLQLQVIIIMLVLLL
jgi:hypothetical protein